MHAALRLLATSGARSDKEEDKWRDYADEHGYELSDGDPNDRLNMDSDDDDDDDDDRDDESDESTISDADEDEDDSANTGSSELTQAMTPEELFKMRMELIPQLQ